MAQHKSRAFVISAADYRETSKLLHLFCENEGRISLIAKGLRSPRSKQATAAEPFSLAQVTYKLKDGETLGLLTGIETERTFAGVRSHLESYALGSFWLEVVNVASQARLASPEFFGLTESFLTALGRSGEPTREVLWHFGRLLQALGFGADFASCAECGAEDLLEHFDPGLGSTVCARCAQPRRRYLPVAGPARGQLSLILSSRFPADPLSLPSREVITNCMVLLNELFTLHLDRQLRSFRFVQDVFTPPAPLARTR